MVALLWALNTIKKLRSLKKWTKVHLIFLGDATPLRPPIMPNFIEIVQTSLEIGGVIGPLPKKIVTDGQKVATKNLPLIEVRPTAYSVITAMRAELHRCHALPSAVPRRAPPHASVQLMTCP